MDEPTAISTAPAAPQPAPAPAPAPAVPSGAQPTYDPSNHITVPKAQLEPWGGRYGDALREAHQYRQLQEQGVIDPAVVDFVNLAKEQFGSPRAALDYITGVTTPDAQPQQPQYGYGQPTQPSQPVDPDAKPLTVAEFRRLREQERSDEQREADAARTTEKIQQEFSDVATTLRGFKFNIGDDGRPKDSNAEIAKAIFNGALNDVMRQDIPEYLTAAERRALEQNISRTPSTPEQRQRATELFQQRFTDFKQTAVVDFVNNQQNVPAGTLGAGPGGPPQKRFEDMSYEERVNAVATSVEARSGRPMGEPA